MRIGNNKLKKRNFQNVIFIYLKLFSLYDYYQLV